MAITSLAISDAGRDDAGAATANTPGAGEKKPQGRVTVHHVKHALRWMAKRKVPYHEALELLRGGLLLAMLEETRGNKCEAARVYQVHRNTISRDVTGLLPRDPRGGSRSASG